MLLLSAILGAILLWLVYVFNQMVRAHSLIKEAWANVDVQLKRRHDLLPKLIEVVKGFQQHEQSIQVDIAKLRTELSTENLPVIAASENAVSSQLRGLLALSEAYPDLKANQNFVALQNSVSEIEDTIQKARRYYNGAVRDNNVMIQTIPGRWIAGPVGYEPQPYFELQAVNERESPPVQL